MTAEDQTIYDAGRRRVRANFRWIKILLIVQVLIIFAQVYSAYDRSRLRTDQRATREALDARGDLFKFILDLEEGRGSVLPEQIPLFRELQRVAGLPPRSSVEAPATPRP